MLPKSITINGDVWRVQVTKRRPSWVPLDKGERDEDVHGGCDVRGQRLWVRRVGDDVREAATLLHEATHALYEYACRQHSGLRFVSSSDVEEAFVESVESSLRSLIRDNDLGWVR